MKKIIIFLLLLVSYASLFGQEAYIECGADLLTKIETEPIIKSRGATCLPPILCGSGICGEVYEFEEEEEEMLNIKVVFHVIHNPSPETNTEGLYEDTEEIHDLIQLHLERANQIFAGTFDSNNPINNGTEEEDYMMSEVDTHIQFDLATTDPCGNTLENIGLQEHFPNQEYYDLLTADNVLSGEYAQYYWPNNYINIFLVEDKIMNSSSILSGPVNMRSNDFLSSNLRVAETLAHEIGHSLGLKHTFESPCEIGIDDETLTDDCQSKGDFVCDTQSHSDYYGDELCYDNDYITSLSPSKYNVMCYNPTLTYIREGFTLGQKQRMRYYLKNHLFSLINEINYTEIVNDTEWIDHKKYVDGYILVKSGAKLSISNSTILFSPYSKIYVEPGGALDINSCSYLSSIYDVNFYNSTLNIWNNYHGNIEFVNSELAMNCLLPSVYNYDILWDGIVVLGNGEEPEGFSIDNVSDNMGIVKINNSTIAYANQAVASFEDLFVNYTTEPYEGFGEGMEYGVIQVSNSDFINNLNSIYIRGNRDYQYSHEITNTYFGNTTEFTEFYLSENDDFDEDGNGYGGLLFGSWARQSFIPEGFFGSPLEFIATNPPIRKSHVNITNSNDFDIYGNEFIYGNDVYDSPPFHTGIRVFNSAINIGKSDPIILEKNQFINLNQGVDVYGLNDIASPVNIYGSYFENVSRGITLNTNPVSQIAQNEFSKQITEIDGFEYNVYLNNSFGCEIFDNEFYSYSLNHRITSICVDNSFNEDLEDISINQSLIYGNTFSGDFNACIDVRGNNTGLQMGCNAFNKYGSSYKPYELFYFADSNDGTPLELDEQGNCDDEETFRADEMDLVGDYSVNRVYVEGSTNDVIFNHGPTAFPLNSDGNGTVTSNPCVSIFEDNNCSNLPPINGFTNGDGGVIINDVIDISDIISVIDITNISSGDLASIRRLLEENGSLWSQKLLINNLVAYKDSLAAEEQLALYPEDTQENVEYKSLLTAINRGSIDVTGKTGLSQVSAIAADQSSKYASMAESALATIWGNSYERNAPNREKKGDLIENKVLPILDCYPNPANKQITIYWEGFDYSQFSSSIRILDLSGQLVHQKLAKDCLVNQNGISLDIENIENGVYIVQIEGMQAYTKLVINR